jgi:type II secretory pathway pseudopilin PulG
MNDNKTDGFTMIETLVSIVFILMITTAVSTALISVLKNNDDASLTLNETRLLLFADQALREKIEAVIFPYWENSVASAQVLRQQIINDNQIPGITINDAEIIIINGSAHGLEVSYSILHDSKIYKTSALFSSLGDAITR